MDTDHTKACINAYSWNLTEIWKKNIAKWWISDQDIVFQICLLLNDIPVNNKQLSMKQVDINIWRLPWKQISLSDEQPEIRLAYQMVSLKTG